MIPLSKAIGWSTRKVMLILLTILHPSFFRETVAKDDKPITYVVKRTCTCSTASSTSLGSCKRLILLTELVLFFPWKKLVFDSVFSLSVVWPSQPFSRIMEKTLHFSLSHYMTLSWLPLRKKAVSAHQYLCLSSFPIIWTFIVVLYLCKDGSNSRRIISAADFPSFPPFLVTGFKLLEMRAKKTTWISHWIGMKTAW